MYIAMPRDAIMPCHAMRRRTLISSRCSGRRHQIQGLGDVRMKTSGAFVAPPSRSYRRPVANSTSEMLKRGHMVDRKQPLDFSKGWSSGGTHHNTTANPSFVALV